MSSILKEFFGAVRSKRALIAFVLVSTVLTLTGPFGTLADLTLWQRARYWFLIVGFAIILVHLIRLLVEHSLPSRPSWLRGVLISSLFAAIYTPSVFTLAHLMTGTQRGDHISSIWLILLIAFSVATALVQSRLLWENENGGNPENDDPQPRLLARLDDPRVRHITHITVRDHYVEVITDHGPKTLLLRFGDALQELDGIAGMQVHRSHWVAEEAVETLCRSGGRVMLRLKNGSEVPVSRAYQDEAESRFS